jgi:hypothetical protein
MKMLCSVFSGIQVARLLQKAGSEQGQIQNEGKVPSFSPAFS